MFPDWIGQTFRTQAIWRSFTNQRHTRKALAGGGTTIGNLIGWGKLPKTIASFDPYHENRKESFSFANEAPPKAYAAGKQNPPQPSG